MVVIDKSLFSISKNFADVTRLGFVERRLKDVRQVLQVGDVAAQYSMASRRVAVAQAQSQNHVDVATLQ